MTSYIRAGDGTVVAWGEERDVAPHRRDRWGASAWTTHPRYEDARHIDRLCADATRAELDAAITAYLNVHGNPAATRTL